MPAFLFVGYLVQELYLEDWPRRKGMLVATMEREVHPRFERSWEEVGGVLNPTEFHTRLPQEPEPGWVINAYSVEDSAARAVQWSKVDDSSQSLPTFAYALHATRTDDGLKLLGYEVIDAEIERLSILNNCGYTVEQVRKMAGSLNKYSLFSSTEDAERFRQAIRTDPHRRGERSHSNGFIAQVWGPP